MSRWWSQSEGLTRAFAHVRLRPRDRRVIATVALVALTAVVATIAFATVPRPASPPLPNIALYYGADLPLDELRAFDIVVVEPDHRFDPTKLGSTRTELFAYVSVGETAPARSYFARLDPSWKVGENQTWGSAVIDQTQPGWQRFFVDEVIAPLWAQGYRGFFLDTMDSYYLLADKDFPWAKQVAGTAALIRAVKARFPEAKLLFNRGFEIVPMVREHVYAVAAESLLRSWNATEKIYVETAPKEHAESLAELVKLRDQFKLPVLVIDYVAPSDRVLARATAAKIRELGFKPYISTPDLDVVGLGDIEVQPRKVLVIVDEREAPDLHFQGAQTYLATPLNYLGYTPEYIDIRSTMPKTPLPGRYAGIVSWVSLPIDGEASGYREWLKSQLRDGMRVAFFQSFGTTLDTELAELIGVRPVTRKLSTPVSITRRTPIIGFELEPIADPLKDTPVRLGAHPGNESLLELGASWASGTTSRPSRAPADSCSPRTRCAICRSRTTRAGSSIPSISSAAPWISAHFRRRMRPPRTAGA